MTATLTQARPGEPGMETNHFLFIASDWHGAMIWPGGIAAYIDSLVRVLRSLGDTAQLVAVMGPDEEEPATFLEMHAQGLIPFHIAYDEKPANWLGRKCTSLLEIVRCLSPRCRRLLERALFFAASTASMARWEALLAEQKPAAAIVFGHLNVKLYALALCLQQQRRPYGIIAHGSDVMQLPHNKKNDLVKRGAMLKGASWVAANSYHTKSLLEMWGVAPERIYVIHPPISEEAITASAVVAARFSRDDELNLVTICRLVKGKGIDIVIQALKILAGKGISCRYVIGGDGPERRSLETLVNTLALREKVHFKGSVFGPDKWCLLRDSDVYVMPSRFDADSHWRESFGIAFAEAAAFGVPSVASRDGGIPDAVADGKTGILVPPESPADVADALTFLYRNPEARNKMGITARTRARKEFAPQTIAACFRELVMSGHQAKGLGGAEFVNNFETPELATKNARSACQR